MKLNLMLLLGIMNGNLIGGKRIMLTFRDSNYSFDYDYETIACAVGETDYDKLDVPWYNSYEEIAGEYKND